LPAYQHRLNDLLAAVFKTVGEAILVANEAGELIMFNNHALEIWGYTSEDLLGQPLARLMPEHHREAHADGMQRYIETGEHKVLNKRVELEALHSSGRVFPIQLYIAETRLEGRRFFTAAVRDITEVVEAQQKLEQAQQELQQANKLIKARNKELKKEVRLDPLTRTLNHVAIKEQVSREMDRLSRSNRPFSILFIDIDDFKKLNDDLGHLQGDSCLRDLTRLISDSIIRKIDTLGRYGGEEFLVVMPGIDEQGAVVAGERLRRAVESQDWPNRSLSVTIGAATADEVMPVDTLIDHADQAMYYGKQHGKNQLNHWRKLQQA
jgi:diguanylate cyclase (GGDEF)-like protein/PAS domain S-box-containing protein